MDRTVSYKISFPDIEVDAIHAKAGILQAIEILKEKADSFHDHDIEWEETHTESCQCDSCMEE